MIAIIKDGSSYYVFYFDSQEYMNTTDLSKPTFRRSFDMLANDIFNESETNLSVDYFKHYPSDELIYIGGSFDDFMEEYPEYFI